MTYDATEFLESLFVPDTRCDGPSETVSALRAHPAGLDVDDLPGDWRVWFEERAAFKEYEGGLPLELAEAQALTEAVALMNEKKLQTGVDRA